MRTEIAALAACLALAACAAGPSPRAAAPVPAAAAGTTTMPCSGARPDDCPYPADVQAFIADRARCDHFRGEPWPEGDTADDRERRRHLVDAVRRECAGMDRRLDALRARYAEQPELLRLLATFEPLGS